LGNAFRAKGKGTVKKSVRGKRGRKPGDYGAMVHPGWR